MRVVLLHERQHAFRRGRGCDTALSAMVSKIEGSIQRGQYALGVFLDISGAFDNIAIARALGGLKERGISQKLHGWYGQYLRNRTATSEIKGCKASIKLVSRTPQGGVLSPLI